ncbi:MAG: sigma factor-like helix-turn-helix DNA-binding protein [Hespellia sp.]|nr:sigma factor-like helix-turn-helix DNA-binding protein [Hespellia sp.]
MKVNYTFANGETSEVEVTEEIGNIILDSRREESNLDRKERYHCYSMDGAVFEGVEYADPDTPETLLEQLLESRHIKELLEELPEVQRRRLFLYAEGKSLREIGRMEGVDHKAVKKSVEAAKKYFLKNF